MADDRQRLISNLRDADANDLAGCLNELYFEYYHISELSILRRFVNARVDLRDRFPDFLHDDADAFIDWLRSGGAKENLLPARAVNRIFPNVQRPGSRSDLLVR